MNLRFYFVSYLLSFLFVVTLINVTNATPVGEYSYDVEAVIYPAFGNPEVIEDGETFTLLVYERRDAGALELNILKVQLRPVGAPLPTIILTEGTEKSGSSTLIDGAVYDVVEMEYQLPSNSQGFYDLEVFTDKNPVVPYHQDHSLQVIDQFPEEFTFVHLTDIHVKDESTSFQSIIDRINNEIHPDFVVITGDIADSYYDYEFIMPLLKQMNAPLFTVPGNHDRRGTALFGTITDNNLTNYHSYLNPWINYAFDYGNYHFIALDSGMDYSSTPGYSDSCLTPESTGLSIDQINGLENKWGDETKKQIILMHHPVLNVWNDSYSWCNAYPEFPISDDAPGGNDACIAFNRMNFIDYCKENNVQMVLSGHTHFNLILDENGNQPVPYSIPYTKPLFVITDAAKDGYDNLRIIDVDSNGPRINPVALGFHINGMVKDITVEPGDAVTLFVSWENNADYGYVTQINVFENGEVTKTAQFSSGLTNYYTGKIVNEDTTFKVRAVTNEGYEVFSDSIHVSVIKPIKLYVQADSSQYTQNGEAIVTTSVQNNGQRTYEVILTTQVVDSGSSVVKTLINKQISISPSGYQEISVWDIGSTATGYYTIRSTIRDLEDNEIDSSNIIVGLTASSQDPGEKVDEGINTASQVCSGIDEDVWSDGFDYPADSRADFYITLDENNKVYYYWFAGCDDPFDDACHNGDCTDNTGNIYGPHTIRMEWYLPDGRLIRDSEWVIEDPADYGWSCWEWYLSHDLLVYLPVTGTYLTKFYIDGDLRSNDIFRMHKVPVSVIGPSSVDSGSQMDFTVRIDNSDNPTSFSAMLKVKILEDGGIIDQAPTPSFTVNAGSQKDYVVSFDAPTTEGNHMLEVELFNGNYPNGLIIPYEYLTLSVDELNSVTYPFYVNELPIISNVQVTEFDGNENSIIEDDEHVKISWNSHDPIGITSSTLSIDGEPQSIQGQFYSISEPLAKGIRNYTITVTDFGNSTTTKSGSFEVVESLLAITIQSPERLLYGTNRIDLNVTASEEIDTWWYSLNSGPNTTFTPNTTIIARYGSNHLIVYANDTEGNINFSEVSFATLEYLNDCSVLNSAGRTYYLTEDIIDSSTEGCINITADDVTLDCQGHRIDGNDKAEFGIYVERDSEDYDANITIKNCVLSDWHTQGIYIYFVDGLTLKNITVTSGDIHGIHLLWSDNNILENINCSDNEYWGIYLHFSKHNTISNITVSSNEKGVYLAGISDYNTLSGIMANSNDYGIYLHQVGNNKIFNSTMDSNGYGIFFNRATTNTIADTKIIKSSQYGAYMFDSVSSERPNEIYNCLFNNTNDIYFDGDIYTNYWNTTRQNGTRVYSNGTEIGGNYWANPDGTGYSNTCSDADKDGFCDFSYSLGVNNVDHLPLSDGYGYGDTTPPIITVQSPLNTSYNTTSIWLSVTLNEPGSWCGYSLDGSPNITMNNDSAIHFYAQNTTMTEGAHTIIFSCSDTAGNMNDSSISFTVDVNVVYFSVFSDSPISQTITSDSTPDFNFTVSGSEVSYSCELSLNGTGYGKVNRWYSYPVITTGLTEGYSLHPTVFKKGALLYLISGIYPSNHGYLWDGAQWVNDSTIVSGLDYQLSPHVFKKDSTWHLLSGKADGTFDGYHWNGSRWITNSTITSGLGDIGAYSSLTVLRMDSIYYLIASARVPYAWPPKGDFHGFKWNGTQWVPSSAITSGLEAIEPNYECYFDAFRKDSFWYLILAKYESNAGYHGFKWNGTRWNSDSTIVLGMAERGTTDARAVPTVYDTSDFYHLIIGFDSGGFQGYLIGAVNSTQTSITSNTSIPEGVHNWNVKCTANSVTNQSKIRELIVDTTPPIIASQSPLNTSYNTTSIWLSVTLNEPGSWCGYSLDGSPNITMNNDSAIHFYAQNTTMTEGAHTIIFSCSDTAGNMGQSDYIYFTSDVTTTTTTTSTTTTSTTTTTTTSTTISTTTTTTTLPTTTTSTSTTTTTTIPPCPYGGIYTYYGKYCCGEVDNICPEDFDGVTCVGGDPDCVGKGGFTTCGMAYICGAKDGICPVEFEGVNCFVEDPDCSGVVPGFLSCNESVYCGEPDGICPNEFGDISCSFDPEC